MAINNIVLAEMEIPNAYLDNSPKVVNGFYLLPVSQSGKNVSVRSYIVT
ncbi:hypothetical protein SLEP1_g11131 [Rubroshorea leprosula]|uniref:PRONE domain-containing protein n=1 Tax=Rubroshorea leprosula TaxID=152421 RepID=A0AAV5IEU3_9ROSI|nr:hypothetical protein SLEP1_g11131 [Rubroshorea leprosula]